MFWPVDLSIYTSCFQHRSPALVFVGPFSAQRIVGPVLVGCPLFRSLSVSRVVYVRTFCHARASFDKRDLRNGYPTQPRAFRLVDIDTLNRVFWVQRGAASIPHVYLNIPTCE